MEQSSSLQLIGRVVLLTILVVAAILILWRFLPALAWAGLLALATWPIREWLVGNGIKASITAMLVSLIVGFLILCPLILFAIQLPTETPVVMHTVHEL